MQQDKSVVFGGFMKIHLMVFHVSGRAVLIRNSSFGEREREQKRENWCEEKRKTGRGGGGEKCGG